MRSVFECVAVVVLVAAIGCGGGGNSGGVGTGGKTVAELRQELLETSKKMDGSDIAELYVKSREAAGGASWAHLDAEFAGRKYSKETQVAYQRWRTAKLAEDDKKK